METRKSGDLDRGACHGGEKQVDLEARDDYDSTPRLRAADNGHLTVVQYFEGL